MIISATTMLLTLMQGTYAVDCHGQDLGWQDLANFKCEAKREDDS
jgi:hypothetical protein